MEERKGMILVVDDNEMNRDLLVRRLQKGGHATDAACGGVEALQKLAEKPFDLIMLDVMMPDLNGYQVLEKLKSDKDLRNIPVLMISALAEMDSVVKCIELGAEDYLPKPFKPVLLHARVNACLQKKAFQDQEALYLAQLTEEKQRTENLLKVILPEQVIEELKETNTVQPRRYEEVAVLFCDIVSFTAYCDHNPPELVVAHLQKLVESYEQLNVKYGIEKIKTIGDAYMCTAGLMNSIDNPTLACALCAQEMIKAASELEAGWQVRIGIALGPVTAGIVGHRKYLFDVWGDTVNLAARMESHAGANRVAVSKEAWSRISSQASAESAMVDVKGKGELELFRLTDIQGSPVGNV